jgi:hypothetical protein
MPELVVIVPTRSRPEAISRVVNAWRVTGAGDEGAELLFVVDEDDPAGVDEYRRQLDGRPPWVSAIYRNVWRPLVPKLNLEASELAAIRYAPMLGFAGDDHLPRTPGWAGRYIGELRSMGTGVVYCDDGYQHENIPTQWAMTADIVRALDRMVPAPVEHLYCDNAVRDLARAAGCLSYLPDVLIEHMHPVARDASGAPKAPSDEQYERVNGREQNRRDRTAWRTWVRGCLATDAAKINALRKQAA